MASRLADLHNVNLMEKSAPREMTGDGTLPTLAANGTNSSRLTGLVKVSLQWFVSLVLRAEYVHHASSGTVLCLLLFIFPRHAN